jgi:hypothetical protein
MAHAADPSTVPARDPPRQRDLALDAVKGGLIVLIALYHAMNYVGTVPAAAYGYLRVGNGAFVFLAGYAAATFHATADSPSAWPVARHLLLRGARLLTLFTALNLALACAGLTSYRQVNFNLGEFLHHASGIYLAGDAPQAAFRILVPTAYLLMLAGLLFMTRRPTASCVLLTLVGAGLYQASKQPAPLVFFLLTGLVGLCLGRITPGLPTWRLPSGMLSLAGCLIMASMMNLLSGQVLAYGCGIAMMFKLARDGAGRLAHDGVIFRQAVLLGRYSLVAYIGQIGWLFGLHRLARDAAWASDWDLPLAFLSTCAVLMLGCRALDALRQQSRLVDITYRRVLA